MIYDKKTYDKYVKNAIDPTDIQIFRSTPFLIANTESGYVFSRLRMDSPVEEQSFVKRTYEFSFEYKDLKIQESFVHHIEFCRHTCDDKYRKYVLDYGTILTLEDLDDFLIIIYKNRPEENGIFQNYDIAIYDSLNKICEIRNVKDFANNQEIDKNKILFYRRQNNEFGSCHREERCVFLNGKEYSENNMNLSLYEWNDLFQPHLNSFWNIENLYSKKNEIPFTSKELMWNAELCVKWVCPLGHQWVGSVNEVTSKIQGFCPYCEKTVSHFDNRTDEKHAIETYKKIKKAVKEYKTDNLELIITSLEEELAELQEMRDMGIRWFEQSKMPDQISYRFAYPNGKHGDIDKSICEVYGEITPLGEHVYSAVLPTNYFEKIELLSESYADKELLKEFRNEELTAFLATHNVMHRLRYLSSLAHQFKMPSLRYLSVEKSITSYRSQLREEREKIYNDVVGENKSTHRWTSEQRLYHLIKSIFSDAIFQYKPKWLGHQSLDIYIPSLKLGIEYQGLQHYEPVEIFGGVEQFKERQKLDAKKKKLCQENEVNLIEWRYSKEITEDNVKSVIESWL